MRVEILMGTLAAAALLWAGVAAQQETRATPGFGSGIVKVAGSVEVANEPVVHAAQRGEWRVAIANTPAVTVANRPTVVAANPDFVRRDARYVVTWPTGESESVTVTEVGSGGWVEVGTPGTGRRRVNLAAARAIEHAR